jgi:hypothetical protein
MMVFYPTDESCKAQCCNLIESVPTPCQIDWQKSPEKVFIDLTAFHDHMLLAVANIPEPLMDAAIISGAIKFGERTNSIRRWINMDLQKDVNEYNLELTGNERINKVHRVWVDGACLPIGEQECSSGCECDLGYNQSFWFKAPNTVMVKALVERDKRNAIRFEVSTVPTRDACRLDREYYERHLDGVIAGAEHMLRMSDKAYGMQDFNLAKAAQQQFGFEVSETNRNAVEAKHGAIRRVMGGMG